MKHTAPATWTVKRACPVSPVPLRRRKDLIHILRGVELGLRPSGHAATPENLMAFFACSAGGAYSVRKRLIDSGYMCEVSGRLHATETGRRLVNHGEDVGASAPPLREKSKRKAITSIDTGQPAHIKRRYQVLKAIKDNPGKTGREVSILTGSTPEVAAKGGGALGVIRTLHHLGLIRAVDGEFYRCDGAVLVMDMWHPTAEGLAALASKGGRA